MLYPLKTSPVFKQYLWGGNNLETKLLKKIPDSFAAESWEISCHDDGLCIIADGEFKGMTLKALIEKYPDEMIGKSFYEGFPLLVKFIDANDKLSVQVHPDNTFADKYENGQLGKTEMWYVLDAKPGAKLIYGLKSGTDRNVFKNAIENGILEDVLNYVPVKKGDFFYIPSGMIHAICEGLLIAEIQQSSNLTYRVYDYNRRDKDGNKRELHTDKALLSTNYDFDMSLKDKPSVEIFEGYTLHKLVECEFFSVLKYEITSSVNIEKIDSKFEMIICVDGCGDLQYNGSSYKLNKGDCYFIPAKLDKYSVIGNCEILRSFE